MAELQETAELLERVVAQTRQRLSGQTPDGATRIVTLHDPDARPIANGGPPGGRVEFGYKAQMVDNVDGIGLDYHVVMGNPAIQETHAGGPITLAERRSHHAGGRQPSDGRHLVPASRSGARAEAVTQGRCPASVVPLRRACSSQAYKSISLPLSS